MQQNPINRLIGVAMLFFVIGQCEFGWGQSCGCNQACRCDLGPRHYTSLDTVYDSRKIPLIREPQIQRFGLTRSWFNRLSINAKTNEIKYTLLQDGTLFVISSDARLHAIDAETGTTLWVSELGPPNSICMAPAANSRMVAALGGNVLYVFNRFNGRLLWQNMISGVAGAGCALSEKHVYVPLASGRILAWPVEEAEKAVPTTALLEGSADPGIAANESGNENDVAIAELRLALKDIRNSLWESVPDTQEDSVQLKPPSFIPLECQSFGLSLIQPVVASQMLTQGKENEGLVWDELLAWPTVRGEIYFGVIGASVENTFALIYQVKVSPQAYSIGSSQLRMDWIAPRELSCQLTYSPPKTLPASEAYHFLDDPLDDALPEVTEAKPKQPSEEVAPPVSAPDDPKDDEDDFDIMEGTEDTEDVEDFFGKTRQNSAPRSALPKHAIAQNFDFDDEGDEEIDADADPESDFENEFENNEAVAAPIAQQDVAATPEVAEAETKESFELPSMVVGGSITGFIVAINDQTGEVLWKYVVGHPITQRMIVVKNHVYACAQSGGMYCLEALRGRELWFAPGIMQFIAESEDYIYCLNKTREIEILDRKTGKSITSFEAIPFDIYIDNAESDRIYLLTKTGLVQCLHETYLANPLKHRSSTFDLAADLQKLLDAEKAARQTGTVRPSTSPVSTTSDWDSDDETGWGETGDEGQGEETEDDFFDGDF